jgi:hypothetical protein
MDMRTVTLSTLAVCFASPAFAADLSETLFNGYGSLDPDIVGSSWGTVNGHVQIGAGYWQAETAIGDGEGVLFEGTGRVNIDLGMLNLEIEAGGSAIKDNEASQLTSIGTAGHIWQSLSNTALGAFGAVNFAKSLTVYTVGVEGEAYFGPITVGADATYNWADDEYWSTRAWAELYVTANTRIGGKLGYTSYNSYSDDVWSVSANAEYRFDGSPIGIWAEGTYHQVNYEGDFDSDFWAGIVGFRVFFDSSESTLQQHDRSVPWSGGAFGIDRFWNVF